MVTSKTIDTKGLPHGEREALIFPSIEKLDGGEKLRLVVEFNPLPLVYMLKARGEFDIAYEKEGPDEWILSIQRITPEEDKKEQFKQMLKDGDVSQEAKSRAKQLLQSVD